MVLSPTLRGLILLGLLSAIVIGASPAWSGDTESAAGELIWQHDTGG